jgi:hypothetical protein
VVDVTKGSDEAGKIRVVAKDGQVMLGWKDDLTPLDLISDNVITNEFGAVTFSFMAVDASVTFDPPKINLDHPKDVKMTVSGTCVRVCARVRVCT